MDGVSYIYYWACIILYFKGGEIKWKSDFTDMLGSITI